MIKQSDSAILEEDRSLSFAHRLVAVRSRFVQLSEQYQLQRYRLEAHQRARINISQWQLADSDQDRQARLEERIRQVEKELLSRRRKRAITQGATIALDHSLLVNSHLQSFSAPALPSRHALLQKHIIERDQLSFRLLALHNDLAKVSALCLQSRKQLTIINRENATLVKYARERYQNPSEIMKSAPIELADDYRDCEDEILLLRTRLSIISPVVQTIISESSLPYYSPSPLTYESLRAQAEPSTLDTTTDVGGIEKSGNGGNVSNERWMGSILLAGENWDQDWDPLIDGIAKDSDIPMSN